MRNSGTPVIDHFDKSANSNTVQLYQDNPFHKCTYTEHTLYSTTDCLESYNNWARKMKLILQRNHQFRQARYEIVWHLLRELTEKEIRDIRTKVFRSLRRWGITAVVMIELTRGKNGLPNNCVHFHILTDDGRSKEKLRELANKACRNTGLIRKGKDNIDYGGCDDPEDEFRIDVRELWDSYNYYGYATKYDNEDKVILFQPGTKEKPAMQKMYEIGNWFIDADGVPISKEAIWDKIKVEMREKEKQEHLACIELIRTKDTDGEHAKAEQKYKSAKVSNEESYIDFRNTEHEEDRIKTDPDDPLADTVKLQNILNAENDNTLTDWFCVLYGKPTIFNTIIPDWLYDIRDRNRRDMLRAIYEWRIKSTDYDKLKQLVKQEYPETLLDWYNHLWGKPLEFNTIIPDWLDWYGQGRKREELLDAIIAKIERIDFTELK